VPHRNGAVRTLTGVECTGRSLAVKIANEMVELTAVQMQTLERLFAAGFRPIAIPPYENALCVHRGECAAVLAPVENGGLRLLSPVTVLVDGNLSVKLKKVGGDVFVWKKKEVAATAVRLKDLEDFRVELLGILETGGQQ